MTKEQKRALREAQDRLIQAVEFLDTAGYPDEAEKSYQAWKKVLALFSAEYAISSAIEEAR